MYLKGSRSKMQIFVVVGVGDIVGISEITDSTLIWRQLIAEFIGTLILVLIGCGSIIRIGETESSYVQIGLTFGLLVATLAQVRANYIFILRRHL